MSIDKKHPSHVTRHSDASSFDEVCINCGARDISGGGWGDLAKPCGRKNKPPHQPVSKYSLRSNIQLSNMLAVRANRLRGQKGKEVMTDFLVLSAASDRLIVLNNRIKMLEKTIVENQGG